MGGICTPYIGAFMNAGGGGGTVSSVNGVAPDGGGNVAITGANLPYTPLFPETGDASTTVETELQFRENHVGTALVIASEPMLEAAAPAGAFTPDTHTLAGPTLWTTPLGGAPIFLFLDRVMSVAHPGSIQVIGRGKITIIGDAAAPLLGGEVVAEGISLLNVRADPAARDLQVESLAGRSVGTDTVTLLGFGGALLKNIFGPSAFTGLVLVPPAPGARGVEIDGVIGSILMSTLFAQAPGTAPYTAVNVLATATISNSLVLDTSTINSVEPLDALLRLDALASYPGGPLPTSIVGLRIVNTVTSGPGSLFDSTGIGADDIQVSSFGHLNGPRSNWIGDAIFNSIGAPPDARLDHVGQANVPLIVPFSNASNGGAGPTLRELTPAAAQARHSLILGTPNIVSVNAGGTYTGGDGNYPATQASTSGAGTGAEFTVTLTAGAITAVASVDKYGDGGYLVADTITLLVVGPTETVAAVLNVDDIAWLLRNNGPSDELTGPINWRVDHERVGGAGSTVFGYMARRANGVGPWVEVPGSRSVPQPLNTPLEASGSARLDTIGVGDEWVIFMVNDNGNSTAMDITIIEPFVEGQP